MSWNAYFLQPSMKTDGKQQPTHNPKPIHSYEKKIKDSHCHNGQLPYNLKIVYHTL